MIILSVSNISKSYGVNTVLEGVSFHLNEGEKVGIIGANGAGKSTLLKILTRETSFDEGDFFISQDMNLGYMRQTEVFDPDNTVRTEMLNIFKDLLEMEEELELLSNQIAENSMNNEAGENLLNRYDQLSEMYRSRNGFSFRSEINGMLKSMAFREEDLDKRISMLSGGEKTRLSLTALLLQRPDLLLLDEPTNYLDIESLVWLEQYLKAYNGAIMVISHDRFFLDQIVNRIFEIENNRLTDYTGNYSEFVTLKSTKFEAALKLCEKQNQEIKRQEEMVRRFRQHGTEKLAKRARSRERRLDMVDKPDKPVVHLAEMKIKFEQSYKSGNEVLIAEDLSKGFGGKELFSGAEIHIRSGEHICMVGANGIGKTTLLKIFKGDLTSDRGWIKLGYNVAIGYYDQEQKLLDYNNTVLQEMNSSYGKYSDTQMRNILGAFLFRGDMVFQHISSLSGGERARLSLLKLILSGANLLLLDEPTNHLDIMSKEIFEKALADFPGAALIVSHDRYLLKKIPDRIVELTSGGLVNYPGGYDYYLEKRESLGSGRAYINTLGKQAREDGEGLLSGQRKVTTSEATRQRDKAVRTEERRKEREIAELEAEIKNLEEEMNEIEAKMSEPEVISDYNLLGEYGVKLKHLKEELDHLYEKWTDKHI